MESNKCSVTLTFDLGDKVTGKVYLQKIYAITTFKQ